MSLGAAGLGDKSAQLIIGLDQFELGVTPPTVLTVGDSPVIAALRFNATAESASVFAQMPSNWNRSVDVEIILAIQLASASSDGNMLDLLLDYVVPRRNATGEGVAKASTHLTPSLTTTTAGGLAGGDAYELRVTLLRADATNPYATGDISGIGFDLRMANVLEVVDFDLLSACISYESLR